MGFLSYLNIAFFCPKLNLSKTFYEKKKVNSENNCWDESVLFIQVCIVNIHPILISLLANTEKI